MKLRWWLLAIYLGLLLASHLVRWSRAEDVALPAGAEQVLLEDDAGQPVRLVFRRWADRPNLPTVLLLHGSPGGSRDFAYLAPLLADRFELIAPDLPGFGASERYVPSYSIRAHSAYVERLLRRLDRSTVHVVGFSMGGGVALELFERAPETVDSVTLLASIGVQEFELLGSFHLNRAIHAAQLAGLTFLHEGVPHFGAFDGFMLDRSYARNFFDTDQRPLREALTRLEVPTLILHGESDPLVPAQAAREHHRIVPHSELVMQPTDHFAVFRDPGLLAAPLGDFLERVERGAALTRAAATDKRTAAASRPLDPADLPRATGLTALVWFVLLAIATLVSEDLTCISAGLLVAQGRIGFGFAALACGVGIFVGDLALFAVGRWLGRPWLRRRPLRWFIAEESIDAASDWFRRRGPVVILLSRFAPGMRLPTYFAAGLLRTSALSFAGYFALAVAIWTPILVGVSVVVGAPAVEWIASLPKIASWALPLAIVALCLLVGLARGLATWRGRRLWVSRLRRWRHFEFWPTWLVYLPVGLWILWLGIRHRSLTLFTAVNPAIPESGFVGESKSNILAGLPGDSVARFERLPVDSSRTDRRQRIESFVAEHDLELPVVLKPDAGERGKEVSIASDWATVDAYLERMSADAIVQEYVPGYELGVFYVRTPGEPAGSIFSITDKRLISVTGDGRSTLERLILHDPRAISMAPLFLRRHHARLTEQPHAGEVVQLVDVGTHSLGALFLDGREFATPELAAEIDRIGRGFDGFYFGRFDLRAPTADHFRTGRDIRVLELNGVTSEATHIYDPAHGLLHAYSVLFEQWRLAFEIGAANRARGVRPTSIATLMASVRDWTREPDKETESP